MNTKKIIGTIIGITAFIALIASATYAWLTLDATITGGVYNASTKNFVINYSGGTEIKTLNQISSNNSLKSNITSEIDASEDTDGWLAVTASKTASSAKASDFKINLAISDNTLTTNSLIYAVCIGTCPSNVALATISNGNVVCASGVANCGAITAGSKTTVPLLTDTTTFNTNDDVSTTTYNIYFWLDSDILSNNDMQKGFSGYIYAEATQGQ